MTFGITFMYSSVGLNGPEVALPPVIHLLYSVCCIFKAVFSWEVSAAVLIRGPGWNVVALTEQVVLLACPGRLVGSLPGMLLPSCWAAGC